MASHSEFRSSGIRVLVAEDTPMFQKLFRSCLEQLRCEVVVVDNGQSALSLLESDPAMFQLLVSDIEMPELNGLELVRRLRAHAVLNQLPAIACSSRAGLDYESQALAAGFDSYLVKFSEEQLTRAASLWLVRGSRRQPVAGSGGGG